MALPHAKQTDSATWCESMANGTRSTRFVRAWGYCGQVDFGDRSWKGVACWPFWNLTAMQLLVICLLLWMWRRWTRQQAKRWRADYYAKREKRGRGSTSPAPYGYLPLEADALPSPKVKLGCCGLFRQTVTRGIESLFSKLVVRLLVQIVQWWTLMVLVLSWMMLTEILSVRDKYNIDLSPTVVLMQTPDSLHKVPAGLAAISFYSYVAFVLLYIFSILNIALQLFAHWSERVLCGGCFLWLYGRGMLNSARDVAIQVHLLPVVYGFLAAKSVECMWDSITDYPEKPLQCYHYKKEQDRWVHLGDDEKRDLLRSVFSSNSAVADLYQAYALYSVGRMLFSVLQPDLQEKIKIRVIKAFERIFLINVDIFVIVCLVQAVYTVSKTWFSWRLGKRVKDFYPMLCLTEDYQLGAALIVSTVAIYNVQSIQLKFEKLPSMEAFDPSVKLWSFKLMVFVSFWLPLLMPLVRRALSLDIDHGKLLEASMRIYMMLLVSIVNMCAWWPWMRWFAAVEANRSTITPAEKTITDVGVMKVPPGTISLVQKLFDGLSPQDAEKWENVEYKINELEDAAVYRALFKGSQHGWVTRSEDASSVENQPSRGGWLFDRRTREEKPCTTLTELSSQERRHALIHHLKSFYPIV